MTIDTHGPSGKVSRSCKEQGAASLAEIVECSNKQVAHFINLLKSNHDLQNTQILIIGDHLIMSAELEERVKNTNIERVIYNKFITSDAISPNREEIIHFDLFPTILDYINLNVKGERLGLGYSAISESSSLNHPKSYDEIKSNVLNYSAIYLNLWKQ
jgi:phosphoglycerol transferase